MSRPKGVVEAERTATCDECGDTFDCMRETALFCSVKCRVAHHRAKAKRVARCGV